MKNDIEIRINSIADAKSVVRNQAKILQTMKDCSLDQVRFLIAAELKVDVAPFIKGLFSQFKRNTQYVQTHEGGFLFQLPHFSEKQISVPIRQADKIVVGKPVAPGEPIPNPVLTNFEEVNNAVESLMSTDSSIVPESPKRKGMPKGGWPKKT